MCFHARDILLIAMTNVSYRRGASSRRAQIPYPRRIPPFLLKSTTISTQRLESWYEMTYLLLSPPFWAHLRGRQRVHPHLLLQLALLQLHLLIPHLTVDP